MLPLPLAVLLFLALLWSVGSSADELAEHPDLKDSPTYLGEFPSDLARWSAAVLAFETKAEDAPDLLFPFAEASYPPAQRALAESFRYGWGVDRNLERAAEWMERAAEAGDPGAQNDTGVY